MSGYEDLGSGVSQNPLAVSPGGGSFSADDRSYETVIFQQNKPPMDWEINLLQMVQGNAGFRNAFSKLYPSGFINQDFLDSAGPGSNYGYLPAIVGNENQFEFKACDAVVNGWNLHLEYANTTTDGQNLIILDSPPAAGSRQDLVILEVWRALIAPSPDGTNKDTAGNILRFGNANAPIGVNLSDDLLDPSYLTETSKRVQIQYRFRTFSGIDVIAYSDGLDDPSVDVHTVPYQSGSDVNGATVPGYAWATHPGDLGLWTTGAGDALSASDLGTVDGYMYAIPVCVVARRNDAGFDKSLNLNGADLIAAAPTERPDGHFADQVVENDIVDLRKTVGSEYSSIRDAVYNSILTNGLKTQYEETAEGSGGNTVLVKDSIGASGHVGNPNYARMTFSDRSVVQPIAIKYTVVAPTNSILIDISNVDLPYASGVDLTVNAPFLSYISDVKKAFLITTAPTSTDLFDPSNAPYITGVEYNLTSQVTINFSANLAATDEVYLELHIAYLNGNGLLRNNTGVKEVWVPSPIPGWAEPAAFAVLADATRVKLDPSYWDEDFNNREITIAYPTVPITDTYYSFDSSRIMIPEMVDYSSLSIVGKAITGFEYNAGCTVVNYNPPDAPNTAQSATFFAYRPAPDFTPDSIDVFYESRAIQSIPVPAGTFTVDLIKRTDWSPITVSTVGSGCSTQAEIPSGVQIPNTSSSLGFMDYMMTGFHYVETPVFNDTSGILSIPVMSSTPYSSGQYVVGTDAMMTTQDSDGRNYWPLSVDGTINGMWLKDNFTSVKRKVFTCGLVELKSDLAGYGRKGSLFLAVPSAYSETTVYNSILTSSTVQYSGVALFRLPGNPISGGRRS